MRTKDHVIAAMDALIRINYDNEKQARYNITTAVKELKEALKLLPLND